MANETVTVTDIIQWMECPIKLYYKKMDSRKSVFTYETLLKHTLRNTIKFNCKQGKGVWNGGNTDFSRKVWGKLFQDFGISLNLLTKLDNYKDGLSPVKNNWNENYHFSPSQIAARKDINKEQSKLGLPDMDIIEDGSGIFSSGYSYPQHTLADAYVAFYKMIEFWRSHRKYENTDIMTSVPLILCGEDVDLRYSVDVLQKSRDGKYCADIIIIDSNYKSPEELFNVIKLNPDIRIPPIKTNLKNAKPTEDFQETIKLESVNIIRLNEYGNNRAEAWEDVFGKEAKPSEMKEKALKIAKYCHDSKRKTLQYNITPEMMLTNCRNCSFVSKCYINHEDKFEQSDDIESLESLEIGNEHELISRLMSMYTQEKDVESLKAVMCYALDGALKSPNKTEFIVPLLNIIKNGTNINARVKVNRYIENLTGG